MNFLTTISNSKPVKSVQEKWLGLQKFCHNVTNMIIIDPLKVQPSTVTHQKEWQELAMN